MIANAWYEISADVKMTDSSNDDVECNPTALWHNDTISYSGISFFLGGQSPLLKEVAHQHFQVGIPVFLLSQVLKLIR